MSGNEPIDATIHRVHRLRLDPSGRVMLPAAVRSAHRLQPGDALLLDDRGDGLRLRTLARALDEAQSFFAGWQPEIADEPVDA
jgi:bifunctional DNA-binding transcriptional regulator/antitoxin component of YhaV-PrlF toxin-antitoxin module